MSCAKGRRSDIPEREVEDYLMSQVLARGGFCYLVAPRGVKGPPDTVVVWPRDGWAQIHLIEVKTIGGGVDVAQDLFHQALAKFNCHVRIIWDKAGVDRYVEEYGSRTSDTSVTMASLLAAGKAGVAPKVPRRKKKPALQLAPVPVDEFGDDGQDCVSLYP